LRRLAIALAALLGACAPLQRDESALPNGDPGELAVVESITPIRVETINSTASDRLVPVFIFAGPIGLAAAGSAEKDFSTTNGRQYGLRLQSGELRTVTGFAIVQPRDCVLLRRDGAGRYLSPMRLPSTDCAAINAR
jgi:hypothetical protein